MELMAYCRQQGLSAQGSKIDLTERIAVFLETGVKEKPVRKKVSPQKWDSARGPLTRTTPVIHYKSDPATRDFFCKEIGAHFRFNADVLTWIKGKLNQQEPFTYGDIIAEWELRDYQKKDPNHQRIIPAQFQFNQFMRDWKEAKAGAGAKLAWAWIRARTADATYARYVEMKRMNGAV